MSSCRRVRLWVLWIPLVWLLSFPWPGWPAEPRDRSVQLVPFSSAVDSPLDVARNVLLFVPFGYSFARSAGASAPWLLTALSAAAVSIAAEALQVFSTTRYASATDVVSGIAGALTGAWWWIRSDS